MALPSEGLEPVDNRSVMRVQGTEPESTLDLSPLRVMIKYPVILLCCIYANIGALMYGFDNITLSLCLSMKPFVEQFGHSVNGETIIPAYWQSLWNAMPQITTGLGAWMAGPIADRFGRRISFCAAGVVSVVGVCIIYTATTNGAFLAGKMVNALGLGMALTTGQTYVSEITPTKLRGIALSGYTFSMNLGFLIAASISFNRVTIPHPSAYKLVFATEWIWPGLLIVACPLLPESPYYLVRNTKFEAAKQSIDVLYSRKTPIESVDTIAQTIREETDIKNSSYRECFHGTNWRRTRIVLYANGISQMIGATFMSNAPYFMIIAGMSSTKTAMMVEMGIGFAIISSVFTFIGMSFLGHRILIMSGIAFAAILFLIMGIVSSIPDQNSTSMWCTGITLQLVWLTMGPSIGPAMAIAAEVSAARLRAKTLSLGFLFNYLYSTVWNVVVPYMFNPDEGDLAGKMGWIFLATCIIAIVIVWIEFPDTKGMNFRQIDDAFSHQVGTRSFQSWHAQQPEIKGEELGEVMQTENV